MDTELVDAFDRRRVQLFVGSGLSTDVFKSADAFADVLLTDVFSHQGSDTCVKELLVESDPRCPAPESMGLEEVAEYYEIYTDSARLVSRIREEYDKTLEPSELHQLLWRLPGVHSIYTTNFDCLIEDAIDEPRQKPEVLTDLRDHRNLPVDRMVFKPHGCARRSRSRNEFVITRDDYLRYRENRPLELIKTIHDLTSKVFLFLGYSLRDLNMRRILIEAQRIASVRCFAVMPDVTAPEVAYWGQHGVRLIRKGAEEFVAEVLDRFPYEESEFTIKAEQRLDAKGRIAEKAIKEVRPLLEVGDHDVFIDAGTTTLAFAGKLIELIRAGAIDGRSLRIITNSSEVLNLCVEELRNLQEEDRPGVVALGGLLRSHTRAITPDRESTVDQWQRLEPKRRQGTLAMMGVSQLSRDGLKIRTRFEKATKSVAVELADHVFVLADHSKFGRSHTPNKEAPFKYADLDPEKMTIITNRPQDVGLDGEGVEVRIK